MIGITLPNSAGADDAAGANGAKRAASSAQGEQGGQNGQDGQDGQGGENGQGLAAGAPEPGIVEDVAADGERGIGRDPLTDDEMERVKKLAMTPAQFASGQNVEGDRGPQHLATNLREPEPLEVDDTAPPRRAEVSYYDYKTDELVTKTVNLATGKVERSSTVQGVQPSPNPREVREAAELILASPLGDGLEKDYRDATGKALTSVDQLQVNGGVYRQEREVRVPAALAECGEHRCVRITSKVKNGPWINTQHLVVDLSARTVGRTD
ncbi:MAG TPA: Tat pathway signal sequence domain protein [Streptomyces sp.]|nr:Tat pathway signal sequence domain protein [Streptomyces sp.]